MMAEPEYGLPQVGAHASSATAATNALDHEADIAKVQGIAGARQHRKKHHGPRPTGQPVATSIALLPPPSSIACIMSPRSKFSGSRAMAH